MFGCLTLDSTLDSPCPCSFITVLHIDAVPILLPSFFAVRYYPDTTSLREDLVFKGQSQRHGLSGDTVPNVQSERLKGLVLKYGQTNAGSIAESMRVVHPIMVEWAALRYKFRLAERVCPSATVHTISDTLLLSRASSK